MYIILLNRVHNLESVVNMKYHILVDNICFYFCVTTVWGFTKVLMASSKVFLTLDIKICRLLRHEVVFEAFVNKG